MKIGKYKYYKKGHAGNDRYYNVLGVALNTNPAIDALKKVVIYRALYKNPDLEAEYGEYATFVRPYDIFFQEVIGDDGTPQPRFTYIGPMEGDEPGH